MLRSARQVAGMSLADLGGRTGLSRGYLSKLESGQEGARNPSRATLVALARALPSFKPLAYQLEPYEDSQPSVTFAQREDIVRLPRKVAESGGDAPPSASPIQLGWRELEALVAYLALERSAAPVPLSALLIARAADRSTEDVRRTLDGLTISGALRLRPPMRPGDPPTYTRGEAFETRLGVMSLGDALILAAALLAQATSAPGPRFTRERSDEET